MSDLYTQVVNSPPGRMIAGRVGLPQPTQLERQTPGTPVVSVAGNSFPTAEALFAGRLRRRAQRRRPTRPPR